MKLSQIGVESLTFYLDCEHASGPQVAAIHARHVTGNSTWFSATGSDYITAPFQKVPRNVWTRMTYFAARCACIRMLLSRQLGVPEINQALNALQQDYNLPRVIAGPANGESLGKDWSKLLCSGMTGNPLFPFYQARHGRSSRDYCLELDEDALKHGLETGHFQFVRYATQIATKAHPLDAERHLPDADVQTVLQEGFDEGSSFGADWDRFASQHLPATVAEPQVSMAELGLFLGHYAELIGLKPDAIAKAFKAWNGTTAHQWPEYDLGGNEDIQQFLKGSFFTGSVNDHVAYPRLQRLLAAFDDPNDSKDVPALTAEWLTATPSNDVCIRLPIGSFAKPPGNPDESSSEHGIRCEYRIAPSRLVGMECAIVDFTIKANSKPPESLHGDQEQITQVTELLKNLGDDCANKIPHSKPHVHPGDEFIFVRSGTVYMQLENTGLWTPLQAGDYIHFNAEIPHAVWNVYGEDAQAVIVRFFQLDRHGTRRQQINTLQEIERLMSTFAGQYGAVPTTKLEMLSYLHQNFKKWLLHSLKSYALWTQIAPWVHDRTRRPVDRLRVITHDTAVQDLVGLSSFLRLYVQAGITENPGLNSSSELLELRAALQKMAADPKVGNHRKLENKGLISHELNWRVKLTNFVEKHFKEEYGARVKSCFEGVQIDREAKIDVSVLEMIADKLAMPRVLLEGYLSPPALRVVAIRGGQSATPNFPQDWTKATDGARGPNATSVEYYLPSRTLANSDMSIVLLDLHGDGHTDWNAHPGFEMVITITGVTRVEFKDPITQENFGSTSEGNSLLIYRSSPSHRLRNANPELPSRALVMRFNVPGQ